MKLKKLVSLALAGVLALSAFSGCSMDFGGNIKANRGMYTKIVAALDDETTKEIKFGYSNAVAADLQKAAEKEGAKIPADANAWSQSIADNLEDIDIDYAAVISDTSESDVAKEQTQTYVFLVESNGASESYVAQKAAEDIDALVAAANLPEKSGNYDSDKYYYAYSYTVKMGVVEISDAVTGQGFYAIAAVLHRVPTKTNNT